MIIIWDNYINFVNKDMFFNIKEKIPQELTGTFIAIGISENFEGIITNLIEDLNIKILEYENKELFLFERA